MVGAHPFGGFNMSGDGFKAGGKDYLLLFMQGKSIAEKWSYTFFCRACIGALTDHISKLETRDSSATSIASAQCAFFLVR